MRKFIKLLLISCLLLCVILVYKANINDSYPDNIKVINYDIDDLAEYLKKHSKETNTQALIEEYIKNNPKSVTKVIDLNDPDLYEIREIKGKQVKAPKKIKKVMINNAKSITFYADGSFGIGTSH